MYKIDFVYNFEKCTLKLDTQYLLIMELSKMFHYVENMKFEQNIQ